MITKQASIIFICAQLQIHTRTISRWLLEGIVCHRIKLNANLQVWSHLTDQSIPTEATLLGAPHSCDQTKGVWAAPVSETKSQQQKSSQHSRSCQGKEDQLIRPFGGMKVQRHTGHWEPLDPLVCAHLKMQDRWKACLHLRITGTTLSNPSRHMVHSSPVSIMSVTGCARTGPSSYSLCLSRQTVYTSPVSIKNVRMSLHTKSTKLTASPPSSRRKIHSSHIHYHPFYMIILEGKRKEEWSMSHTEPGFSSTEKEWPHHSRPTVMVSQSCNFPILQGFW